MGERGFDLSRWIGAECNYFELIPIRENDLGNDMTRSEMLAAESHLFDLQKVENDGAGISFVRAICQYLNNADYGSALAVYKFAKRRTCLYPKVEAALREYFGEK